jgi:hypothetical protein
MLEKIQIKNLQEQLDKISSLESDMKVGAVNAGKFTSEFYQCIESVKSILIADKVSEKERDIFNNLVVNKYLWRSIPKAGSMPSGEDYKKIDDLKENLEIIIKMSSNFDSNKKEWSFPANDSYKAKRFILGILKKAVNSVKIIDNYLDEEVFDYLDSLEDTLNVYLITDDKKKMFLSMYKSYIVTHFKTEARINNQSHDRFIIIDDQEIFALGASLNTIGKKDFMVHKIEDETEKIGKVQDFANYWSAGVKII